MDDIIDDEAAVATKRRRTVWVRLWIMRRLALCYYISKYKIIYAFKLRCRHCVEYNTHYAVQANIHCTVITLWFIYKHGYHSKKIVRYRTILSLV